MENDSQWKGEMVLADVLDNVLKNLNAGDLCRAAQVCKSWTDAVKLEFSRRGPQIILIPTNPTLVDSEFRVANVLSTKPNVVVLFCGPGPHFRKTISMEFERRTVLTVYNNRLPAGTKLIVVGVDQAINDEMEILSCPTRGYDELGDFKILGLALPNYRNVKVDVAGCMSYEEMSCDLAKRVAKKLMPEPTDQKFTLIMFGRSQFSVSIEVLKIIKSTCKSQSYTLWGGMTQNFLKVIDCSGDNLRYMGMEGVICVKITGQSLEAHTTVISYAMKFSEIKDKLLTLKEKVKLRRHKLGLVCGCNFRAKNYKLMKMIRKVFPGVLFTLFFNYSQQLFGFDSTSDDPDQELVHTDGMSIMILTYD